MANPAFIQGKNSADVSSGTTLALSYTSNLTTSSYLLASVTIFSNTGTTPSTATLADSAGNVWTLLASSLHPIIGGINYYVWGAPNTHGVVADTATFTFNIAINNLAFGTIAEYSPVNATKPVDVVGAFNHSSAGAPYNGATVTTAQTSDTVIGIGYVGNQGSAAATGQTVRVNNTGNGFVVDQPATTLGGYSPSLTFAAGAGEYHLATIALTNTATLTTAIPTLSPWAGVYAATQTVTISCATAGSSIFYTTDGSTPTTGSTPYTVPITVASTQTVKAIASASGFANSAVNTVPYTIGITQALDTNAWYVPEGAYLGIYGRTNAGMSYPDSPGVGLTASQSYLSGGNLNLGVVYSPTVFPGGAGENGPATLPLVGGCVMWKSMQMLYGTVEVRAKLTGINTHPAIWMLSTAAQQTAERQQPNSPNYQVNTAEIDMVEGYPFIDGNTTTGHYHLFPVGGGSYGAFSTVTDYSQNFHAYKIVWAPGTLTWYVDGVQVGQTATNVPSTPCFLILDLEAADAASGEVSSANFPQSPMQVDYAKAWAQDGTTVIFFDDFTGAPAIQNLSQSFITFIQAAGNTTGSGTTVSKAYALPTSGTSLLLAITQYIGATGSASLADTLGNTWIQIGTSLVFNGNTTQLWAVSANIGNGGANTVTATMPVSGAFNVLGIAEYTGPAASPIDIVSAWTSGTGTAATTTAITTTLGNETLVAFGIGVGTTATVGAGYTLRLNGTNPGQVVMEDQNVLTLGGYTSTWTQASGQFKSALIAIKSMASVSTPAAPAGNSPGTTFDAKPESVTLVNSSGDALSFASPTVGGNNGQPIPVCFTDPNGNEYSATGATVGGEIAQGTPVVLCNANGQAIVPPFAFTTGSTTITWSGSFTGTHLGNPTPVVLTGGTGLLYLLTGLTTGILTESPTPIVLCDANGNMLTGTIAV